MKEYLDCHEKRKSGAEKVERASTPSAQRAGARQCVTRAKRDRKSLPWILSGVSLYLAISKLLGNLMGETKARSTDRHLPMAMMRMWKHNEVLERIAAFLLLAVLVSGHGFQLALSIPAPHLGINYGMVANNLPAPADVVPLIQSIPLAKAKLYDADSLVLETFINTGISFIVSTSDVSLLDLSNPATATAWVQQNIIPYIPNTNIIGIVVGNEIFDGTDTTQISQVLPAMKNVYAALTSLGIDQIVVSTAHSFAVLSSSYPPSAGEFSPLIATPYMKPILEFLSETGSPFMINAYPFFAYKADPATVSLEYVLFEPNDGVKDPSTGLTYYNMFDAQMDAVYSAIATLGYTNVSLLVSETGWPSAGDSNEVGASVENAQKYHENLFAHVISNQGTPLRPKKTMDVYMFALFNEDLKNGPTSERNYGLFKPDGTPVYRFDFAVASSSHHHSFYAAFEVSFGCCVLLVILLLC